MTWMFIISTTIWVNGWDTSSVASRARSELTSSQCNWKGNQKGKGTDETPLWSFVKRYEFDLRIIFDQWPKLHLGLDVRPEIPILKGL